jgi:hypothetical protein
MPISIFGKTLGGTAPAKGTTGLKSAPGGTRRGGGTLKAQPSAQSKQTGRQGASGPPAANAGSNVYAFNQTINAGNTFTYPLTSDGDFINLTFQVTMTFSQSSASTDILTGLSTVQILAPGGPVITSQPAPDFYLFSQRFGPYGVAATLAQTTVTTTGSHTAVGTYQIPWNLPAAKGPYTLVITAASSALANTTVMVSMGVELQLQQGVCPNGARTNYVYANVPFTPSNSGTNDFAPLAPIQDVALQEMFLTGLATNTTAISYIQLQSVGQSMATRLTGYAINSIASTYLTGSINADYMYPLLALQSTLQLGRNSHLYITWGSTAPSAPRTGFVWFD